MNTIYIFGKNPTKIKEPWMAIKIGFVHQDKDVDAVDRRLRQAQTWLPNVEKLRTFPYADTDTPIHNFLRAKFEDICHFNDKGSGGRESIEFRVENYPVIIDAIQRFINNEYAGKLETFELRPEHIECRDKTVAFFQHAPNRSKFLWDAKMRFGKTHLAYCVAKSLNYDIVLIFTNRPTDTIGAWEHGIDHIEFAPSGQFLGYDEVINMTEQKARVNIDGSLMVYKNKPIFSSTQYFDVSNKKWASLIGKNIFIIADECHVGIDTKRFSDNLELLTNNYHMLMLSGTPFKFLLRREFSCESKYTWSYLDEQRARKQEIERMGEIAAAKFGHYYPLSPLRIFIMDLAEDVYKDIEYFDPKEGFTFTKLFHTDKGKFVNDIKVESLLNMLTCGREMPFSRQAQGYDANNLKHTLWLLPGVDECKVMSKKLGKHPIFKNFTIKVAAGDNDGEGLETAKNVCNAITEIEIQKSDNRGTITLSCGKLTHGVSIKQWGAVLNLSDMKSSWRYFQSIFRVQTPYRGVKNECYVFDFSYNRTLTHLYKLARAQATSTNTNIKDSFREILHVFNPFYDGNFLKDQNVDSIIDQIITFDNISGFSNVRYLVGELEFSITDQLLAEISKFSKSSVSNKTITLSEDKGAPSGKNYNNSNNGTSVSNSNSEENEKELTEAEVRKALEVLLQSYLFLTRDADFDSLRANLTLHAIKCEHMMGLSAKVIETILDGFTWENKTDITDTIQHFRYLEAKDNEEFEKSLTL